MKKKSTAPIQYRQGDVLIERTEAPTAGNVVPRDASRVILAYGEVTGHAHALMEPGVRLRKSETVTTLEVEEAMALLKHDEHATIEIPNGTYRVIQQREYTPAAIRNVAD